MKDIQAFLHYLVLLSRACRDLILFHVPHKVKVTEWCKYNSTMFIYNYKACSVSIAIEWLIKAFCCCFWVMVFPVSGISTGCAVTVPLWVHVSSYVIPWVLPLGKRSSLGNLFRVPIISCVTTGKIHIAYRRGRTYVYEKFSSLSPPAAEHRSRQIVTGLICKDIQFTLIQIN